MHEVLYPLIIDYGYFFLFIILMAGIVGFPIPDEGVLIFAGGLAAKGVLSLIPIFICSVSAVFIGSMINYQVAASCIELRFSQFGKWFRKSFAVREKSLKMITQYGLCAIPLSYFIPGVRIGVSYTAGLLPFDTEKYMMASFIGVVCWVGVYLFLGYHVFSRMEMMGWIQEVIYYSV